MGRLPTTWIGLWSRQAGRRTSCCSASAVGRPTVAAPPPPGIGVPANSYLPLKEIVTPPRWYICQPLSSCHPFTAQRAGPHPVSSQSSFFWGGIRSQAEGSNTKIHMVGERNGAFFGFRRQEKPSMFFPADLSLCTTAPENGYKMNTITHNNRRRKQPHV